MRVSSRWVRGVWLGAFAVLAGNTVLASYNVNVLIYNDERVDRARAAKQEVADLVADLIDAETGQRGYLISADREFLQPYEAALARIGVRRARLRLDLAGDPAQAARFAELDPLVDAKLAEMARTLAVLERDGPAAARALVRERTGRRLMVAIRASAGELEAVERARLAERSEVSQAKYRMTTVSNIGGGGLAMGIVWLAYSLIRFELARRRRAEAEARLAAAALAASQRSASEALAQLDAFLDHAPIGIAFYDTDLRYRRVNRVLAAANGVPVADHVGRTAREVLPEFPPELAREYERVLATGRPLLNRLVPYEAGAAGVGGGTVWELTLFPVPGAAGDTLGLGAFAQDVTLREQAQDRLRASEDRFRTLADAVPLFVWSARPDGGIEYYNSRWYEYTKLTPAECLGQGWADPLHPDDVQAARAAWRHSLSTGEPYTVEYRVREGRGGEYRWFLGRARPVRDPSGGAVARWYGTGTDIEDQKRLEGAVRASERRFRSLTEAAPGFVFSFTAEGGVDYLNEQFARYSGLGRAGARHAEWAGVVHPDDRPTAEAAFYQAVRNETGYEAEYRLRRTDGAYRWFQTRAVPVAGDGGPTRWHGISTDIDDRVRLEMELRDSEARLRALADAMPQIVFGSRGDGYTDYFNRRWYEFTGFPPGEDGALERWADALHPDDRDRSLATWRKSVAEGSDYQIEFRFKEAATGEYRWHLGRAVPERDGRGRVKRWYGTCTDIDDSKRLAAQLSQSEARFRMLAETVPGFVWSATADGRLDYTNSRVAQYSGVPGHAALGEAWDELVHPDDRARAAEIWAQSLATGRVYQAEFRLRRADGAYRWFVAQAAAQLGDDGRVERWYGTTIDVDDFRNLQADLVVSQARFQTLAEAVPGIMFSATPDGQADYLNPRFEAITGRPTADSLGLGWGAAIHPDDLDRVVGAWTTSIRTLVDYQVEFRMRTRDGRYRWFLAQGRPSYDAAGAVERWYGTTSDVSDLRELQADAARSQARFRTLAEAVPGFVFSATRDGKVTYINARFGEVTGQSLEETYERGWEAAIHPDDSGELRAGWLGAARAGTPYRFEYRLLTRDGQYRWYTTHALPTFDAAGAVDHWYGTAMDVHDSKALAVRAELDAERFRLLTESIPQLVWNADATGRATYFNTNWRDYTGLDRVDAVRDWWPQVVHPEDASRVGAVWDEGLDGKAAPVTWEVRLRRAADGAYRWFSVSVVPLCRPDGSVDQWIGSLSDIEEQKRVSARLERLVGESTASLLQSNEILRAEVAERQRAEQRERAAAVELRRSNYELEKFAYVASHDLQEPLRKIQAFGDRLASRYRDAVGEQGRDYIERMQSSATRMRGLINDILTFSRVTTRTQPFVEVDLNEAVREALSNLEVRLAETGGRVEVATLPTLPGDPTQMKQLFQNLLGNALKFARPGVPPEVRVSATPTAGLPADCDPPAMADGIRVEVVDNGIGFEQVYAERIFEVFQRLHGRGTYEGTGIGLAICRKIAERHGGSIAARSELGGGARFVLDLPVAIPEIDTTATPGVATPHDGAVR